MKSDFKIVKIFIKLIRSGELKAKRKILAVMPISTKINGIRVKANKFNRNQGILQISYPNKKI